MCAADANVSERNINWSFGRCGSSQTDFYHTQQQGYLPYNYTESCPFRKVVFAIIFNCLAYHERECTLPRGVAPALC